MAGKNFKSGIFFDMVRQNEYNGCGKLLLVSPSTGARGYVFIKEKDPL